MKKLYLLLGASAFVAVLAVHAATYTWINGTTTNTVTLPASRSALAAPTATRATLTLNSATITYQMVDGSTGTVSVVTNVSINTVWGHATGGSVSNTYQVLDAYNLK